MNDISNVAYRYVVLLYAIMAAYIWYFIYSLWFFLGKNYLPQNVSSIFSIQNSNFSTVAVVIASVGTILLTGMLIMHKKLRNFVMDVGDELSCVAWPTLKETQKATGIVIGLVIVAALILFFADSIFTRLINLVLGTAGV